MRVLCYNIRSLRDDKHAVARVISAAEPDVVCIQEAPRFLRWRSKCAQLARASGLFVITGGRPAGAMLLLGRIGVDVHTKYDVKLTRKRGLHQRGLAMAIVSVHGARFGIASMHLDLDATERLKHVPEVFDFLARLGDVPVILAGDVNEQPHEPAWQALAARLVDAYEAAPDGPGNTYSATNPHKRIDGIFVDRRIEVMSCGVPQVEGLQQASDHLPLLAVLRIAS